MRAPQLDRALGDWQSPLAAPRMRIYRNNVVGALTSALEVRYPVTAEIVGQNRFRAMAAGFADRNRPESPVLIGYGGGFPDFIRESGLAPECPYLADVARLESLWWQSFHAAEAEPLNAGALSDLEPEAFGRCRFAFHPAVRLIESPFAAATIWQLVRGGAGCGSGPFDTPQRVLIARPHAEVSVSTAGAAHAAFLAALQSGRTLEDAVGTALDRDAGFDINGHIAGLFGLGLVTGFQS